ncbi:rpel repeat-containing protein [Curvularia clavata]|uniref:Rpel repeat-containing protein n=1 Tax=Curvularia clavata TaxID=95742 RepID=A0A9Q8ZIM4_CURCL|nr:rpel repeat-containing protein [Curvularia clavata]
MASENTDIIDETPISPVRSSERRNSLEKHLQHRPEPQDLKNRHILLDTTTAPALQAKALELERQRATDNLKKGLSSRPDRAELVDRNILPNSTAAPALQGHQKELDMHMRADSLEKGLQNRPSPEELVKKGILEENENPIKDA